MHTLFHTLRCTAAYARHLVSPRTAPDHDADTIPPKATRVALLLHGYLGRATVMHTVRAHLMDIGIPSVAISAPISSIRSFEQFKRVARAAIGEIRAHHPNVRHMDLVGHSMGGVAGAELLHEGALGDMRVTLTALGSPFFGTWTGLLGAAISPSARELLPTHPRARTALVTGHGLERIPFLSLAGGADFIAPPNQCRHPHAEFQIVPDVDHAGLLYRRRVLTHVTRFLRAP
jgi:pimeloyl-ACP methyl ester carboxylesterase